MDKIIKTIVVGVLCFSIVGCGSSSKNETSTLETQVVSEIKIDIPDDMSSFEKNDDGDMESYDKDKSAGIMITKLDDADGQKANEFTDSDIAGLSDELDDFKVLEFDNKRKTNEVDTIYARVNGTNENDTEIIMDIYVFIYADDTFQSVIMTYSKNQDSSLKSNIDKIGKSIKVEQKESSNTESSLTKFPLKIVNSSTIEIAGLYCSTADTDNWEEELLNGNTLYTNDSFTIDFTLSEVNDLVWDFKLVAMQGAQVEFYDVDFNGCSTSGETMTISTDDTNAYMQLNGKTYTGVVK